MSLPVMMLRCIWCCRDTPTDPCAYCKKDNTVVDPYEEHDHLWSRKTINTMECKVCDLEVDNAIYFSGSAPVRGRKPKPEQKEKPKHETQKNSNAEVRSGADALPPTPSGEGDKNGSSRKTRPGKKAKPQVET